MRLLFDQYRAVEGLHSTPDADQVVFRVAVLVGVRGMSVSAIVSSYA
ncbi:hypothetical protein KKH27_05415 [bacterium]|nr:hypothetical protein [bacterium]